MDINKSQIIITTTNTIEGKNIEKYLGVVTGQCVLGTGIISEKAAQFADLLGTESLVFGEKLKEAKMRALSDMKEEAHKMGAEAVVGVKLDITIAGYNMCAASANGTAVTIKEPEIDEQRSKALSKQSKNVWITNYYSDLPFRLENAMITASEESDELRIQIFGVNYGGESIQAIKADVDYITIFDTCISEKDLSFSVNNDDDGNIITPEYFVRVQKSMYEIIKEIKVHIRCFVTDGKPINVEQSTYNDIITDDLAGMKEKYGKKYFADPEDFEDSWECICGHINKKGDACSICGTLFSTYNNGIGLYAHLYGVAIDKKNAIEIYELYKDYIAQNPSEEMSKHLEKLKSLADIERMYGNCKNSALKYIEENIC